MNNWVRFNLHEPGMGMYHRAGLAGLTASLIMMKKKRLLPANIDFDEADYDEQGCTIRGLEPTANSLHALLQSAYKLNDDGLFDFPVLDTWNDYQKSELQKHYLGSFLQHPSARKAEKNQRVVSIPFDEETVELSFLPIRDFRHRFLEICEIIEEAVTNQKNIELAGWAMPGGVVRHNALNKETALSETPKKYFLLLFAPLGCLYFQGMSYLLTGEWDKRTQTIVVVPRPKKLSSFADALVSYYEEVGENRDGLALVRAAGITDAAFRAAILLQLKKQGVLSRLSCELTAIRFGTVGWSQQQKTRTGVFTSTVVTEDMIHIYREVLSNLQRKIRASYYEESPFVGQIADNLVANKEWYHGISAYMQDERRKKLNYWRKGMNNLVQSEKMWKEPIRKAFVEMIHSSIRIRYGKVSESGMFEREYERMRQTFVNCRTQAKFRETLMDFVTRSRPHLKSENPYTVNELLLFACKADWREGKDLCLLALASYQKEESEKN